MEIKMEDMYEIAKIVKKTESLNSIIKRLYLDKYELQSLPESESASQRYKDFAKDTTERLKSFFAQLEVNIEDLKNTMGRYEIPYIIAEIFYTLLKQKSGKGSYISKIKLEIRSSEVR